jgi:hypothetical protein
MLSRWKRCRMLGVYGGAVLLAAIVLTIATAPQSMWVRTVTFKDCSRVDRFRYGVAYYMKLAGVTKRVRFLPPGSYPGHPDYCAWVIRDAADGTALIGLNDQNPDCTHYKPEWLALHETCHLIMAHTSAPFDNAMSPMQKETEVDRCMRDYDGRTIE